MQDASSARECAEFPQEDQQIHDPSQDFTECDSFLECTDALQENHLSLDGDCRDEAQPCGINDNPKV